MKGLFISGSGTDVGKTFIAIHIIKVLNQKFKVVARKPVESNCQKTATGPSPKDAILLNNACTTPEAIDRVCKFALTPYASGEKASIEQGINLTLADLVAATQPANQSDFVVVEGAGGLYSPIAQQALNSDLARALGMPVVIVVRDEIGALNQALLSLCAAKNQALNVAMLVLNQITPNNLENAQALRSYTDANVVVFNQDCKKTFASEVLAMGQVALN